MISPSLEWFTLVIHVVSVSVWVGGQITLLGLLKTIREHGEGLMPLVARRFGTVSWTAFGATVVTGVLLLLQVSPSEQGSAYSVTLAMKLLFVFIAATAAVIHSTSRQRLLIALGGAIGLLASLGALALGVLLAA